MKYFSKPKTKDTFFIYTELMSQKTSPIGSQEGSDRK